MRAQFAVPVLAAAIALAAPVSAASDAAGSVRAGMKTLIGEWSPDCTSPPSAKNEHESFVVTKDGGVQAQLDTGEETYASRVVSAEQRDNGDVAMRFEMKSGSRIDLVYRVQDDRQMTWYAKWVDGAVVVQDGRDVPEGGLQRWYHRCETTRHTTAN